MTRRMLTPGLSRWPVYLQSLLVALTTCFLMVAATNVATGQVIYNSIPPVLPGNVGSEGPEAYAFSEIGDGVIFAGTFRNLQTVTVVMSDWACQTGHWFNPVGTAGSCVTTPGATFSQDITLKIYNVNAGPTVGSPIASKTVNFQIPYRPSSDAAHCAVGGVPGGDGEQWYSAADNTCYHGFAFPITFDFTGSGIVLPSQAIFTVVFNTSDYGPVPQRPKACNNISGDDNCPYDSLNVGVFSSPIVGNSVDPNGNWFNYTLPGTSCSGAAPTGTVIDDTPCWTAQHPGLAIVAGPAVPPGAYLVSYAPNLISGDSYVNLTNTGVRNGFDPAGGICANVYAFDSSEELISCCSCYVTPDGLKSLSAKQDLVSNTLTLGVTGSLVIKLLASAPVTGSTCSAAAAAPVLEAGLRGWGTSLHQNTASGKFEVTENVFQSSELSVSELTKLTTYCGFIQANGSGFGLCRSCRLGGLGGAQK
jgi:hypothetical protein